MGLSFKEFWIRHIQGETRLRLVTSQSKMNGSWRSLFFTVLDMWTKAEFNGTKGSDLRLVTKGQVGVWSPCNRGCGCELVLVIMK